jgi:hypothetical protein
MMFLNWECPAMRFLSGFVRDVWNGRRGVIGRDIGKIKDLPTILVFR